MAEDILNDNFGENMILEEREEEVIQLYDHANHHARHFANNNQISEKYRMYYVLKHTIIIMTCMTMISTIISFL